MNAFGVIDHLGDLRRSFRTWHFQAGAFVQNKRRHQGIGRFNGSAADFAIALGRVCVAETASPGATRPYLIVNSLSREKAVPFYAFAYTRYVDPSPGPALPIQK